MKNGSIGPDWLQFKHAMEMSRNDLIHSAKGTTWKDHKYIKKENGRYFYTNKGSKRTEEMAQDKLRKLGVSERNLGKVYNRLMKDYPDGENLFYDLVKWNQETGGKGSDLEKLVKEAIKEDTEHIEKDIDDWRLEKKKMNRLR